MRHCPVVLVPNGSKPLCNFLVHISSFLPGASALAPGVELGIKTLHHKKKGVGSADGLGHATSVSIAVRNEDILVAQGKHFL